MFIPKKPFHLIQVFSNSYHYNKGYKEFSSRRQVARWHEKIDSGTMLSDDFKTLTLSKDWQEKTEGVRGNAIILEDYNPISIPPAKRNSRDKWIERSYDEKNVWLGNLSTGSFFWKIFTLTFDKKLMIYLHWDQWQVGFPRRFNFKIIQLELNQPVQIVIDGKRDFSLSGRRERTFIMNDYIFEYKGPIDKIETSKNSFLVPKRVPDIARKINLLKYVR